MLNLPSNSIEIPPYLKESYAEWKWEKAWQFEPETLTIRLSRGTERVCFMKLTMFGHYPALPDEAERTRWTREYLPAPRVIEEGLSRGVCWLVTAALPGRDATHPESTADTEGLVRVLARGLRRFHEAPVDQCPFDFCIERALAHARERLEAGRIIPEKHFHDEFIHLTAKEAIEQLERTRPDSEDLVVCHGDYCLPNVLIDEGEATGFLDLGELGVADRWWDLAVATWSVTWNLGPGYDDLFFEEYGISRDNDRIEFYRLLYDVVS